MRRTALVASLVVLLLMLNVNVATTWAQSAKPNFSGTWNLDLAKSDFGPAPPPESMTLVIVHKEPAVTVNSTQKSDQGEVLNERHLTTDGKTNTNKMRTVGVDEQDVTSTTTWSGRQLVTSYTLTVQGTTLQLSDAWDISADGKVLTIMRAVKTPDGDFNLKTVFNKR